MTVIFSYLIITNGERTMVNVKEATGSKIRKKNLIKKQEYFITNYGAVSHGNPIKNTEAINQAISDAAKNGGGCVVFPSGEYKTYTIELKSNVNIRIEKDAIIRASRTDIQYSYEKQVGEGGNYLEPERNLYVGLQDHGHSYFANSLFYACEQENIMIYGSGKIDGSYIDTESGYMRYTLMGGDPFEPECRTDRGYKMEWFGNKGIALVRCKNIVLADFSFVIGGHFAVIAEGIDEMYVDSILVDTTRDAFDIDCCQNVTVRNSTFNSLTDDALVIKASYGAGLFMPSKNILIEDCVVSGYDAGSVYAGTYSCDKLVATDSCGPTGRVKLGTESTCGYERVTVRRVKFKRSRGFALEAVDGSDLTDIIFEDVEMDTISSSPIFIRIGDRGRFPVTGINTNDKIIPTEEDNVRLDNKNWILPNAKSYKKYPVKRYVPSYKKDNPITIDGYDYFNIVNQDEPVSLNGYNIRTCLKESGANPEYLGNAVGADHIARISRIMIRNVNITNVDPRYPIIIMGLMDSKVENVWLENIHVVYRGGLKMEHAVEQRQLFTNWEYKQYMTESSIQKLPWLVNPFFVKDEGLLPRVVFNPKSNTWEESPYNIPELPSVYPEPSNWGILPAYGMYIRHAQNIILKNISISTIVPDERDLIVLDDIKLIKCENIIAPDHSKIICVENRFKRSTNKEYIKNEPYKTTTVSELEIINQVKNALNDTCIEKIVVNEPAPGTPNDKYYNNPTVPSQQFGYQYKITTEKYPLPLTVYRPFFLMNRDYEFKKGGKIEIPVILRDPVSEATTKKSNSNIYNEKIQKENYINSGWQREIIIKLETEFEGIQYNALSKKILIDTESVKMNNFSIILSADDYVIKENFEFHVHIC